MVTKISRSTQIYWALVVLLSVLTGVNVFLPQVSFLPAVPQGTPPKLVIALANGIATLIIYGGLGFIGLKLSFLLAIPTLWDSRVSHRQRFVIPALAGIILGAFFIVADLMFQQFHDLGAFSHPSFPTSVVVSINAAIGEEIIFRLFLIPFGAWLISKILLKGVAKTNIFWFVSTISAVTFALAHLPAVMLMFNLQAIHEIPIALMIEIILLNGIVSFLAAYYFKSFGFLAAVSLHFWTDVVWHIIWGVF
ncbi:CPBP family intramembrane metalloprotease [Coleofasciculus sp. FACHB-712]|uniref:CPBP family glutamic-type intramembrane protease n=1 Tax=Cyanophyceae TaxID=3028117 RepID=UPI001685D522|nr:CPBP family glutamic-type intramembrane protease [Coleofasciculus sp. FACHB-712]MBD1945664.1 CPBP family intramembrane metalloprotease [Coleofasciculus sp. FACHB-712]